MIGIGRSDLLEPDFQGIWFKIYAICAGKAIIFIDFAGGWWYIYELLYESPNG
jgi:hypothetical protein